MYFILVLIMQFLNIKNIDTIIIIPSSEIPTVKSSTHNHQIVFFMDVDSKKENNRKSHWKLGSEFVSIFFCLPSLPFCLIFLKMYLLIHLSFILPWHEIPFVPIISEDLFSSPGTHFSLQFLGNAHSSGEALFVGICESIRGQWGGIFIIICCCLVLSHV